MNRTTAVPVARTLSDGQEYTFSPMTFADWSAFNTWVNSTEGRRPKHIVPLDETLSAAQSIDGMLWIAWRSVLKTHKTMTKEALSDLIGFRDLTELIPVLIDMPDEDDGSDPNDPAVTSGL